MTRPRLRTLINGSSRAYVGAGPDTEYGSEPPFDENEDFDPVAEKYSKRLAAAVYQAGEKPMATPLKLRPAGKGKCQESRCKNAGKIAPLFSVVGRKLCFDCVPKTG